MLRASRNRTIRMNKRTAIGLLAINILSILIGAALLLFISSRSVPDSGVTTERLDAVATRLAAQSSQSAIAEVLHRDDTYIQSLLQIGRAQRSLLWWVSISFAAFASLNLLYVVPAFLQRSRNAS